MHLELIRSACDDGKTCPALHQTDRNSVIVQGWAVLDAELLASMDLFAGAGAVEVPSGLLAGALDDLPALRQTGRGTVIVPGLAVDDPEALRHLRLPAGERAVEVPAAAFAGVLRAC